MTKELTLPRFIWGEGLSFESAELNQRVFLTHTQVPRFICEIWEADDSIEVSGPEGCIVGEFVNRNGVVGWQSNAGFIAANWAYMDAIPKPEDLDDIMFDAALDFQIWNLARQAPVDEINLNDSEPDLPAD